VFYFNGRKHNRRWRIIRRGVSIKRRRALYFPGKKGHYATGPRFPKYRGSFTISFFFKTTTTKRNQILIGQWSKNRWQYLFRIWKGGQLGLYLRSSNAGRDIVPEVRGGRVLPNRWYYGGFSWNHHTGVARIYLNGKVVGTRKTKLRNHNLYAHPLPRFQLGYKKDSNSEWFHGLISNLRFTRGVMPNRRFIRYTRGIRKLDIMFSLPEPALATGKSYQFRA
jgi:hypothetical protein